MSVRLRVENYRVLRKIDWELPRGVCALVGPNGSGKTTLLEVPEVLRDIFANSVWDSLAHHGSMETLRSLHAERTDHVKLEIALDAVEWQIDLILDDETGRRSLTEVIRENQVVVDEKMDFPIWALRQYGTGPNKAKLKPPISHLTDYRLYHPYDLDGVRLGSGVDTAFVLLPRGQNIFSVLRNWRDRRSTKSRYEFVVESLKEAFPDVFEELELEFNLTAKSVTGRFFGPGSQASMPIQHAPSGMLTGLLHLAAVASTEDGGIVAIDEPENGLHPYAVKRILQAMRDWADDKDLTVLLATHSPMLLDQFKEDPEHLYVMEPGQAILPVRLDQVRDREWLAQFSLGDLYKGGDFGAPIEGAAA